MWSTFLSATSQRIWGRSLTRWLFFFSRNFLVGAQCGTKKNVKGAPQAILRFNTGGVDNPYYSQVLVIVLAAL